VKGGNVINIFKGFLIGIANLIPGVSGGTFALILGIYGRLINDINKLGIGTLKAFFTPGEFKEEFKRIDGIFLLSVAGGALASIAGFSWLIDFVLKNYPGYTLAFFAGLILPSIAVPYKFIDEKNVKNALFVLPGALIVAALYAFPLSSGAADIPLVLIFFSGFIAICAMVLPGISGSFLLLATGVYGTVISHIKNFFFSPSLESFVFLTVFASGAAIGLIVFVKLMKRLLEKYKNKTFYFLIGLILGSMVVLWPFKVSETSSPDLKAKIRIASARNRLPSGAREAASYAGFFAIGLIAASLLAKVDSAGDKQKAF